MFDFGLDSLFARIEKDFGSFWARSLLLLIVIAIASVCISVIGTFVYSSYQFLTDTYEGSLLSWWLFKAAPFVFVVGAFISFGLNSVAMLDAKTTLKVSLQELEQAQKKVEKGNELLLEIEEKIAEAKQIIADAKVARDAQKLDTN